MKVEDITAEKVVFFFNKYKHNTEQIIHLERRILSESYDFEKWQEMLAANSELTRKLFVENEKLINEYIEPVIKHPERLSKDGIHAFLLHVTFFLFENNIDFHVTDDLVTAILEKCPQIDEVDRFEGLMNLGICNTVSTYSGFDKSKKYFDEAKKIYPDFASAPNDDICIHLVFCRTFELLSYALYKKNDYVAIVNIIEEIDSMVRGGNTKLYKKMWGENGDFPMHIALLKRYFKIYAIFTAGQCNFEIKDDDEAQKKALNEIQHWLTEEYAAEGIEQNINPMIYTFFKKNQFQNNKINKSEYLEDLKGTFENFFGKSFIFADCPFPVDDDPVEPKFALMLDRMKIFNWSFCYVNILIPELYRICEAKDFKKRLTNELIRYYENSVYAEKGFMTDDFIFDNVRLVAENLNDVNEFLKFTQTIFVHREINSAIHFSMVGNLAGMCLSHFIERKPELFVTKKFPTAEAVRQNRTELLSFIKHAGVLHDIGKLSRTNLVNLHLRKITDDEYSKIKEHTVMGEKLIEGIDYLAPFHDIIVGHHKYFNGNGGYPDEFDVISSEIKVFINLISICDTIDTSTDHKGRNYAKKKNFDQILVELKKMTERYSPELVKIIDDDEALKEELRYMTSTGRKNTSYETYCHFIQPNTFFSEEDERTISMYCDKFETKLFDFYKKTYPDCSDEEIKEHIFEIHDGSLSMIYILHDKKDDIYGLMSGRIISSLEHRTKSCIITDLVISPEYRRRGFGTELLAKVSQELKEKNIHHIKVNVKNDFTMERFFWIEGFSQSKTIFMDKEI